MDKKILWVGLKARRS